MSIIIGSSSSLECVFQITKTHPPPFERIICGRFWTHEAEEVIHKGSIDRPQHVSCPRAPKPPPVVAGPNLGGPVACKLSDKPRAKVSSWIKRVIRIKTETYRQNHTEKSNNEGVHTCSRRGVSVVPKRQNTNTEDSSSYKFVKEGRSRRQPYLGLGVQDASSRAPGRVWQELSVVEVQDRVFVDPESYTASGEGSKDLSEGIVADSSEWNWKPSRDDLNADEIRF